MYASSRSSVSRTMPSAVVAGMLRQGGGAPQLPPDLEACSALTGVAGALHAALRAAVSDIAAGVPAAGFAAAIKMPWVKRPLAEAGGMLLHWWFAPLRSAAARQLGFCGCRQVRFSPPATTGASNSRSCEGRPFRRAAAQPRRNRV